MKNISFQNVDIDGGFWAKEQQLMRNTTLMSVYNRFRETGRFSALDCTWQEGEPNMPHIFWDSDIAKWMEAAAYLISKKPDKDIENIIDDCVEKMVLNADENGYFNSHFLVTDKDKHFYYRSEHELYCAGHLIEAAVAYYNATGKDKFLKFMCRYVDYIYKVFIVDKSAGFITPGHPEIELALVKLYNITGNEKYLELSKYFIDEHGKHGEKVYRDFNELYNQDEMPLCDRTTADGHCVRALYLMCGAADVGKIYEDTSLVNACKRVFQNIVNKRMYITGGVGSTHIGEAFTVDYDLPNRTAYAETCGAISLAMFCGRMQTVEADSHYADTVERVIYNGMLSGISLDGKSFFYENPLEIVPQFNDVNKSTNHKERYPITQRLEVFDCSCCPPNIVRFISSLGDYIYSCDENTVYVQQYMNSKAEFDGMTVKQSTEYPKNGNITISGNINGKTLSVRIPDWCKSFKISNEYQIKNGYAYIKTKGNFSVNIDFDMPIRVVRANNKVYATAGKIAFTRGPVVYCAEGIDNGKNIASILVDTKSEISLVEGEFNLPVIKTAGYKIPDSTELYRDDRDDLEKTPLTLIPYFAFANRGESEMQVWMGKFR